MNRFTDLRDNILPLLRPYVKRIAVFGSFARGEETPESDIDILVELKDPEKRPRLGLGWFGLEEDLSRILGREVELIAEDSLSPYLRPMLKKIWFCYMKKDEIVFRDLSTRAARLTS